MSKKHKKPKPLAHDPGGHCACGTAWVNHHPVLREEGNMQVRRICTGEEVYTAPVRLSAKPKCPACQHDMSQVVPGKFGCVNYSGGCVNTRRLYTRDGMLAGGA